MIKTFVKFAAATAAGILISVSATAAGIIGPVYPPPGFGTYSSTGSAIQAGGAIGTYSGIDLSQTGDLYWGPSSSSAVGLAMDGAINASSETLGYDSGTSNLAAGYVTFTGSTTVPTTYGNVPVTTRMTLQVLDLSNNALALTTSTAKGILGGVFPVLEVLQDFKAVRKFEAFNGSSWVSAQSFFDNTPNKTASSGNLKSSFSGGFFYTENAVPEPATLGIVGLGFAGLAWRRRRI